MSEIDSIIRSGIDRCERIVAGLDELRPFLAPVLPVTDDDLTQLATIERIASVALLKRYEQLQDMIGRLMRALLSWHLEDVRAMTRKDVANWMEKLRLIEDADDWIDLTDLRNRLLHEYPIAEVEQVDRVNESWAAAPRVVAVFEAIKVHLDQEGFVL